MARPMPASDRPDPRLAGEILGATIRIDSAPGLARGPIAGVLVDETLATFVVRLPGKRRLRRIPKAGLRGAIHLEGREIPLIGEHLRHRPEDRTKRLLLGGRRNDR